jgi:hypothetical protein
LLSTVASDMPRRFNHAGVLGASHAQVLPVEVVRLSQAKSTGVTGAHKRSLMLFLFLHPLFLPLVFLLGVAAAPCRFWGAHSNRSRWWPNFSAMS